MKKVFLLFSTLFISIFCFGQTVIINEIHYDNVSTDAGEGFEIAGTAGLDLAGYTVVFYNGNDNQTYGSTINLSGVFTDETNGFGFIWFDVNSFNIQNGSPDGLALVKPSGTVLQFISYEGTITATNGPASGLTSTDIGVSQNGSPIGQSLQFNGTSWVGPLTDTRGSATVGQTTLSVVKNQIENFVMYPNPVSNGNLFLSSDSREQKQVDIYALTGQRVYSSMIKSREAMDISNLNNGLYLVKIIEAGNISTRKLIVN